MAADRVVITGNPLASTELAQPSASLAGDALTLRRAGTLGETLERLIDDGNWRRIRVQCLSVRKPVRH